MGAMAALARTVARVAGPTSLEVAAMALAAALVEAGVVSIFPLHPFPRSVARRFATIRPGMAAMRAMGEMVMMPDEHTAEGEVGMVGGSICIPQRH